MDLLEYPVKGKKITGNKLYVDGRKNSKLKYRSLKP
jgi:hypothetical protein